MVNTVETSTPANTPDPIGPYNHIAKVGRQEYENERKEISIRKPYEHSI